MGIIYSFNSFNSFNIKMMINIKFNTEDENIQSILNENFISVITLDNDKILRYNNHPIILVSFVYNSKLESQAFYKDNTETWKPFDGIKATFDDNGNFTKIFDTLKDLCGFGTEKLMFVSYILGGGIWSRSNIYSEKYNLRPRIQQFEFEEYKVKFENSMIVNHFINYSISYNYLNLKKDENRKSAFDGAHKSENWSQMEYVPIKKSLCKDLDDALYKNNINTPLESSNYMCNIL